MPKLNPSVRRTISPVLTAAVVAAAGLTPFSAGATASLSTVTFTGVFRDFRAANVSGGHPDFEVILPNGSGVYTGIVADTLNEVGTPVFASTGHKSTLMPRNILGKNIIGAKAYLNAQPGDLPGVVSASDGRAVTSAYYFGKWYDSAIGATTSQIVSFPMAKSGARFTYDGTPRKDFDRVSGTGSNKNWAFTFEMETEFVFQPANNEYITCGADDCMWVFINDRLVIDLGGQHDYVEQTFDVNRLQGLEAGKKYSIKFFYAERRKTSSRLMIDTTLGLNGLAPPGIGGKHD